MVAAKPWEENLKMLASSSGTQHPSMENPADVHLPASEMAVRPKMLPLPAQATLSPRLLLLQAVALPPLWLQRMPRDAK